MNDLRAGDYDLDILPLDKKIRVVVLDGAQWEASNQIYDKNDETVY